MRQNNNKKGVEIRTKKKSKWEWKYLEYIKSNKQLQGIDKLVRKKKDLRMRYTVEDRKKIENWLKGKNDSFS